MTDRRPDPDLPHRRRAGRRRRRPVDLPTPPTSTEVVSRVHLATRTTFARRLRAAPRRPSAAWARSRPRSGRRDPRPRPHLEANKEALARSSPARSASPTRGARRGAGGHRHLHLLRLRGPAAVRHDRAVEMPDKQLFTFRNPVGTMAVITAGNFPSRCRPGTSSRRCWPATPWCGSRPSTRRTIATPSSAASRRRHPGRGVQLVLADGPTTSEGLERRWRPGTVHKVGFTGSSTVGRRSRRCAASTWSRRRSSSAARTRWW
jgi:alpha-ketoglutaric semialdehyde dehydrogenase